MPQGSCFVVMGFGRKTDFETGRTLDLDKSYQNMIKPAVEATGLTCIRADEIVHSGLIDLPMYEQLLKADVVVADLSTSNKNALYELGIRHALKPYTTIVIAEDGIKTFPFDVNHISIRQYHHLGEDIGCSEAQRFQKVLIDAIGDILQQNPRNNDSPVYSLLSDLIPPSLASAVKEIVKKVTDSIPSDIDSMSTPSGTEQTRSALMQQVDEAQERHDFATAQALLATVRVMMKSSGKTEDPYIVQRLAFLTYKSEQPTPEQSLYKALALLQPLNPQVSNDTETLGIWGSLNKRLYELTKNIDYLSESIRAYRRGFNLRNDTYNGINLAYLFNVRAAATADRAEAIADFIQAQRYRKEVLDICEQWLQKNQPLTESTIDYQKGLYWTLATKAEAYIGIGQTEIGEKLLEEAYSVAPESWMKDPTVEQIGKLKALLVDSPLKYIQLA